MELQLSAAATARKATVYSAGFAKSAWMKINLKPPFPLAPDFRLWEGAANVFKHILLPKLRQSSRLGVDPFSVFLQLDGDLSGCTARRDKRPSLGPKSMLINSRL